MGVDFIIILENIFNKNQEEINQKFGISVIETKTGIIEMPNWRIFSFSGKSYCSGWFVVDILRYINILKDGNQ